MSNEARHFGTPRRTQTQRRSDDHPPANAPVLPYYQDTSFGSTMQVPFNMQQNSSQSSQPPNIVVPSNASSLPGALQVGGSSRPQTSSTYNAPTTIPSMAPPPLQTNASQYAQAGQTPSRTNTLHSHSRSSPGGMEIAGQRYIPFNQTPTQTPTSSNPKAFNVSTTHTPTAGPSHSPLNLTDIRSRAISDANDTAQGTAFYSYSDTPTNSNYLAPFPTYAFDWCKWPVMGGSGAGKMAVGSYLEDPHNFIQILDTHIVPQDVTSHGQAPYGLEYTKIAEATCAYPVTRILWEPPSSQKASTDLLATSGDHLRLWSLPQMATSHSSNNINRSAAVNNREPTAAKLQPLALLSNSKSPEHTAPLTSLDWNTLSPKLIITSSIDTTCTIWDIPTLTAKTQLIAHDREVYDVRFCAGSVDVFVSCGADGSVRMFDLRSLEHSTIIYEPAEKNEKSSNSPSSPTKPSTNAMTNPTSGATTPTHAHSTPPPLLRLAASPHDAHLLATFASESNLIRILDVRQPGTALLELRGHTGTLNSIEWNPHRRGTLASGADDGLVLVWDLLNSANQAQLPPSTPSSSSLVSMNGGGGGGGGVAVGAGNGGGTNGSSQHPQQQQAGNPSSSGSGGAGNNGGTGGGSGSGGGTATAQEPQKKGPFASWRCEYEVGNVSWAPQSPLTTQGGDWLGVCAGRGVWGVKL